MGKGYPPEVIPDVGVTLPAGRFVFSIESMDDSEKTSTGKYQIRAALRVVEPASFAHLPHFENFVVGTVADPEADDPDSWKGFAAARYRSLLEKAGVVMTGDIEQDTAVAVGQQVGAVIEQQVQAATNKDGSPNAYAGRVQSRVQSFFHPGERETGVDGTGPAPAKGAAAAAMAAAKATAQAAKPAVAAPKPAVSAPKPATGKLPPPNSVKCSICNQMVSRNIFPAHVQAHEVEEE